MAEMSTPPPPDRLNTPPTPMHGPKYDTWEPFSPRRSARVSSRRGNNSSLVSSAIDAKPSTLNSPRHSPAFIHHTPRKSAASAAISRHRTTSSRALSPPSSPDYHTASTSTPARSTSVRRSLFTSRQRDMDAALTSDSDMTNKPSPFSKAMLPTPSKTPRKRPGPGDLSTTARILSFQPVDAADVMPTPRKPRRSRLTLDEHDDDSTTMQIYTDVQARIPDRDGADDNPFLGPRQTRFQPPRMQKASTKQTTEEEQEMEEAVRRNEGLIYTFRGKKIFRPFAVPPSHEAAGDEADAEAGAAPSTLSDSQTSLKRMAGGPAARPLTRSKYQPRLLWPETHNKDDEEADTDIEEEHRLPALALPESDIFTPAKKIAATQALTPPSSHRATRSAAKNTTFLSESAARPHPRLDFDKAVPSARVSERKPRNISPFDKWQRTKAGAPSGHVHGKKRAHSPSPTDDVPAKRTRSGAAAEGV